MANLVKITLIDNNRSLTMQIDPVIVSKNSRYFKYFLDTEKQPYVHPTSSVETSEDILVLLNVCTNATQLCKKEFETILNTTKVGPPKEILRTYSKEVSIIELCIIYELPIQIPTDIVVSPQNFDLLRKITELLPANNSNNIKVISNNLPEKYKLDRFSKEYVTEMLNSSYNTNLIIADKIGIAFVTENNNVLLKFNNNTKITTMMYDSKLAYADIDFNINIWKSGNHITRFATKHTAKITSIDINEKYLITSSADNSIKIWSNNKYQLINTLHNDCNVNLVKFCGNLIISSDTDGYLKLWDKYIDHNLCTSLNCGDAINDFTLSYNNKYIISASNCIKVWKPATKKIVLTIKTKSAIKTVFHHGRNIISASINGEFEIWDFKTGEFICNIDFECNIYSNILISSNHTKLYLTKGNIIKIWHMKNCYFLPDVIVNNKIDNIIIIDQETDLTHRLKAYLRV